MSTYNSFWRGKICVVTGGVGFIGSHLSKRLHGLGARVTVLDREPSHQGTLFAHLNEGLDISTMRCDLSHPSAAETVRSLKPDVIFHLAALPYAPYTTLHPREAYASNVISTVHALEGARLSGARRFVLASSACVFGAAQHSPLRVGDAPSMPEHYYSVTKQDAERQVRAFNQWYELGATLCRFGNVYGPGDRHFGRIVPQLCRQLIKEGREVLRLKRSGGDSTFEFLYVDDAVEAFVEAAARESGGVETLHFSGGEGSRVRVLELAKMVSEIFDGKGREVEVNSDNPERRVEKYLDMTDTRGRLEWLPRSDFRAGLEATVEWYKRHIDAVAPAEGEMLD